MSEFETAHDAALALEEGLQRLRSAEDWKDHFGDQPDEREHFLKQTREALRYLVREDV